jgi:hypothetical protein
LNTFFKAIFLKKYGKNRAKYTKNRYKIGYKYVGFYKGMVYRQRLKLVMDHLLMGIILKDTWLPKELSGKQAFRCGPKAMEMPKV